MSSIAGGRARNLMMMRPGVVGLCSLCGVALSACSTSERTASTGVIVGDIAVPQAILTSRAVDMQRLVPTATVGNTSIELVRRGDSYSRKFTLLNENEFELTVYWDYLIDGREEPLPLARTSSRLISLSLPTREITVAQADYDTSFDEDDDGMTNIDELAAGRDPLVKDPVGDLPGARMKAAALATLRDDQADCHSVEAAAVDVSDTGVRALSDIYLPVLSAETIVAPVLVPEQREYRAQVALTEAGTLTIDALGGEPGAMLLQLHDRKADTRGDTDLAWVSERSADKSLDVELRSGLYCLSIRDARSEVPGEWGELSDLVLSIALIPLATN